MERQRESNESGSRAIKSNLRGSGLEVRETSRQYTDGLASWLSARRDRDKYLMPLDCSDPRLARIDQLAVQLVSMLPSQATVVDLGFGPEGRDMADLTKLSRIQGKTVEVFGLELVHANIVSASQDCEFMIGGGNVMAGRLVQSNLEQGIPIRDSSADALILSSVIQHIPPNIFFDNIIPELARILKAGGLLDIIFKATRGEPELITVTDQSMGGTQRTFQLYNAQEVLDALAKVGLRLYSGTELLIGGVITWIDQIRRIDYAAMYLRKD